MAMYHTQLKKDIAVHPWLSLSHLACMFCYWAIGHSPVHSSKHTTLPDDELQKTCRLLPSNNKISAANLENRRRGQRGTACHWCNQGNLSAYRTIWKQQLAQYGWTTNVSSSIKVYRKFIMCMFFFTHFNKIMLTNWKLSLTRYEVACCNCDVCLDQCRISPIEKIRN